MWTAEAAAPTSSARSSAPAPIRTSSRRHPSFRARIQRRRGWPMWTDRCQRGSTALMFAATSRSCGRDQGARQRPLTTSTYENPDHITALMLAGAQRSRRSPPMRSCRRARARTMGTAIRRVFFSNLRTNETAGEATRPAPVAREHAGSGRPHWPHARARGQPDRSGDRHDPLRRHGRRGRPGCPTAINESPFALRCAARTWRPSNRCSARAPTRVRRLRERSSRRSRWAPVEASGSRRLRRGPRRLPLPGRPYAAAAVAALLAAGADVNAVNDAVEPRSTRPREAGNVAMIVSLPSGAATLDVQNKAGFTPSISRWARARQPAAAGPAAVAAAHAPGRGGGPGGPQPQAIALLRELMGLPPLASGEMPGAPVGPQRGGN